MKAHKIPICLLSLSRWMGKQIDVTLPAAYPAARRQYELLRDCRAGQPMPDHVFGGIINSLANNFI